MTLEQMADWLEAFADSVQEDGRPQDVVMLDVIVAELRERAGGVPEVLKGYAEQWRASAGRRVVASRVPVEEELDEVSEIVGDDGKVPDRFGQEEQSVTASLGGDDARSFDGIDATADAGEDLVGGLGLGDVDRHDEPPAAGDGRVLDTPGPVDRTVAVASDTPPAVSDVGAAAASPAAAAPDSSGVSS